jgi:hypothetical protein
MAALQPHMAVLQVAMIWSIGMSLQSVVLVSAGPIRWCRAGFAGRALTRAAFRQDAATLTVLTGATAMAAAMLVHNSEHFALAVVFACNALCVMKIWRTVPPARPSEGNRIG